MKKLGIAFLILVGVAVLGDMFGGSPKTRERVSTEGGAWEEPSADSMIVPNQRIPVSVQRMVLNFGTRRMSVVGRIPKSALSSSGTVFIWAFFTNPGFIEGSWSGFPVRGEVTGAGDTLTVSVRPTEFPWANNDIPRDGYRAYVIAGPDSATLPIFSRWRDKSKASTPVSPQ